MFKKLFQNTTGDGEKSKRLGWILILGASGVAIMILSSFIQVREASLPPDKNDSPQAEADAKPAAVTTSANDALSMVEYEQRYEKELEEVLSKIGGVEDVSVIVNLNSTVEEVLQVDKRESRQVTTETDKNGGKRSVTQDTEDQKTAYYRGENGEKPVVIKKLKPQVRGVLVVARGVENLKVKAIVIEAVQRTLDVPVHRISVLPKG
jgi:stage III sporulation protein AG